MENENNFKMSEARKEGENPCYEKRKERVPREILVWAALQCKNKDQALDLGAGNLVESEYLLKNGFKHVTAVDRNPRIKDFKNELNMPGLRIEIESFDKFEFGKDKYDLISAQFSLPFYDGEDFEGFIRKIIDSLRSSGVFTGQFFGEKDDRFWGKNKNPKVAYRTKEEIEDMFRDLETLKFIVKEKDGALSSGEPKHWHVFTFVVRKK